MFHVMPNPLAVPEFVIVAPESIVSVEPDNTFMLLAVNLKSSAPAMCMSIWSSVSDVMLVSASASSISSLPFMSSLLGNTRVALAIFALVIAVSAILAVVTCESAICAVSIEPSV